MTAAPRTAILAAALAVSGMALAGETAAPEGAKAYFVNLRDGAAVSSPVRVVFGLRGMGVAPAGTQRANTGHHHLLIDRPPLGEGAEGELNAPLPADDHHRHFGGGQTETVLDLPPGEHSLQLVLGDKSHVPHEPPVASRVITITVE
ncbi:rod shape-determining protein RodA [Roseovarius sp. TE539]|uniref:DUF4399 domain-containing protein n=1 Tax=Roseovarius sp. TE539 TaxID=2249812 RepID=UPI000DE137C1|nr:DUF4399 domain-containing protein [Roseovarius sp. TE539]RBI76168.1 rod shape-determining protein RodA [Roseovarius sp. TE539]